MTRLFPPEEANSSVLSDETIHEAPEEFDSDDISSNESEDVMDGIDDDDEEDDDSDCSASTVSTSPLLKLIPTALASPQQQHRSSLLDNGKSGMPLPPGSHLSANEPRPEKGVDRLLLMARYPNADESQIQQALQRKELQQRAAKIAATKKAQLFREQKDLEDAERWRLQQEREQKQLEQLRNEYRQHQQNQELQQFQQQQQLQFHQQIEQFQMQSVQASNNGSGAERFVGTTEEERVQENRLKNLNNDQHHPKGSFGHAASPSKNILPKGSQSGTDEDEEEDQDASYMWVSGMARSSYESENSNYRNSNDGGSSGEDHADYYSRAVLSNSGGDTDESDDVEKAGNYFYHRTKSGGRESPNHSQRSSPIRKNLRESISKVAKAFSSTAKATRPVPLGSSMDHPAKTAAASNSSGDHGANRNTSNAHQAHQQKWQRLNSGNNIDDTDENLPDTGSSSFDTDRDHNNTNKYSVSSSTSSYYRNDQSKQVKGFHQYNDGGFGHSDDDEDADSERKRLNGSSCCVWTKRNKLLVVIFSFLLLVAILATALMVAKKNTNRSPMSTESSPSGDEMMVDLPTDFDNNLESNDTDGNSFRGEGETSTGDIAVATPWDMPRVPPPSIAPASFPTENQSEFGEGIPSRPPVLSQPTDQPTTSSSEVPFLDWTWDVVGSGETIIKGTPQIDQRFGESVAISEDGNTLVVGSPNALGSGIVRIYQKDAGNDNGGDFSWKPIESLLGRQQGDGFGTTVALSKDGRVLAVGEPESDGSTGDKAGNVRTYVYSPFGYVSRGPDLEGTGATDHFGLGLALSGDGSRLAIGAPYQDNSFVQLSTAAKQRGSGDRIGGGGSSLRSGSNGSVGSNGNRLVSGAVIVYEWSEKDRKWIPMGAPLMGESNLDWFGKSLDLSNDGSLLCVGSPRNIQSGGHVRCFKESEDYAVPSSSDGSKLIETKFSVRWKPLGDPIRNTEPPVRSDDNFGASVSVSTDPTGKKYRVAIGAPGKNGANSEEIDRGEVTVYEFNPETSERGWIRLGREVLTPPTNEGRDFRMGHSLDLHHDKLVVGMPGADMAEVFEFERDNWRWIRHPRLFEGGNRSGSAVNEYGAAVSMTPFGDFIVGSPLAGGGNGSVQVYQRD